MQIVPKSVGKRQKNYNQIDVFQSKMSNLESITSLNYLIKIKLLLQAKNLIRFSLLSFEYLIASSSIHGEH